MKKLLTLLIAGSLVTESAFACTDVNIQSNDGSVIAGRTMEWAMDMGWQLQYVPKGTVFPITAPSSVKLPTINVTSKYSFAGVSTADVKNSFTDGQNEKGLSVSANFLPGFTQYESVSATDKNYMSILQAVEFILASYSTVDEVKQNFPSYKVWSEPIAGIGFEPTLHFLITDKSGKSIVIEFIKGQMVVFDDSIGVMTNAPNYNWHLINLRNYLNLDNKGTFDRKMTAPGTNDEKAAGITSLGQGSGGFGLPGDYTSPSRFVKIAYLKHYAKPTKNADEAVQQVAHILNNVDIPNGSVADSNGNHVLDEVTQWIIIKDLKNNQMYLADYAHRTNYAQIDLNQVFKSTKPMSVKVSDINYPSAKLANPFNSK